MRLYTKFTEHYKSQILHLFSMNMWFSLPVVIACHLLHDLAVNFISECFVMSGWFKDLVCELQWTLNLSGGIVTHVL